jgi:hypothetical protein
MDVPTDRRLLTDPRERLEDVRDLEAVVRLGVLRLELRTEILGLELRLEVIDLDRLVEALRVDRLEVLLRLDDLGATDRLGLRVTVLRDVEREAAALRLRLLELLLFRELLAAITGPTNKKSKQMMEKTRKIGFSFPFFCLLFSVFRLLAADMIGLLSSPGYPQGAPNAIS